MEDAITRPLGQVMAGENPGRIQLIKLLLKDLIHQGFRVGIPRWQFLAGRVVLRFYIS